MNNTLIAFTITFLAGLSTIIGIIPCFFKQKQQNKLISNSLAFSSGVMITISLISLIPEAISQTNKIFKTFPSIIICSIFILIGIGISTFVNNKVETKINNNNLYKLGIITTLVLIIHNLPEGITTFISTTSNMNLGIKLSIAIALHNIPEGISIAVPIYYATNSKKKAFLYTSLAGFSELLGSILAYIFLKNLITPIILSITLAVTAGIMIDISIYEFIPNAFKYKNNKAIIYCFVIGIIIMFLTEYFLI